MDEKGENFKFELVKRLEAVQGIIKYIEIPPGYRLSEEQCFMEPDVVEAFFKRYCLTCLRSGCGFPAELEASRAANYQHDFWHSSLVVLEPVDSTFYEEALILCKDYSPKIMAHQLSFNFDK